MSKSDSGSSVPDSNFVDLFIDHFKEYESPTSFWRWAAYSTIAATLRTKVYYAHGNSKVFPNIYVILLADSAEFRKGAPIMAARSLISITRATKIFSGTASIQAILEELATDIADKSGMPLKGGSSIITADELASFFVSDPRLIPLLTDIWEPRVGDDVYSYKLRSGDIKIKDLCTSMLAASNETFLREVYDSRAIYGGLLGRTYMIKPDETRPPNSLMFMMDLEKYEKGKKVLVDALFKIKTLEGPVSRTPEAAQIYDDWYNDLYKKYKKHPDKTGVLQRMHTNVLKLAIVLACANYSKEITATIFEEAILQVTNLKQNYEVYVMSAGKNNFAQIGTTLLVAAYAKPDKTITRKEFMLKNWNDVTAEDFDKIVETLKTGGVIDINISGIEIAYVLTQKGIAIFNKKEEK
jgi:hypothetical protein